MCLPFNMNLYMHKEASAHSKWQKDTEQCLASGREIRLECGWGRETGGKGKFSSFALIK